MLTSVHYGWLRRLDAHPYQKVHRCHYQPFRKGRAERPVGGNLAAAQRQDTAKRKEPETFLVQCFKPDTAGKVSQNERARKRAYETVTLRRQRSEERQRGPIEEADLNKALASSVGKG